jgi:type I restriction enzyme S subunit
MRTEKFKSLFKYAQKSNLKASDGKDEGNCPFYTSSSIISKRTDKAQYFDEALIFGNGGTANIHYCKEPFATTSHCFVAIPKIKDINPKYVYYYLFGNIHLLERGFKGAGLKNISPKYIENLDIPIFSIEIQNKIIAILDKASSLVTKKEESIVFLDELLRATFLDMFGDPVKNPKGWPIEPFNKIGEFKSGGTPSKENSNYWSGSFPWVSPKDMKVDYVYDSIDHISETVFSETSLKKVVPGNILIVVRGMILAHSFPVAINKVDIAINQDMKAIFPSANYESEYLLSCLKIMKGWILQYISTAAHGTKKLNSDSLEKIILPCPPLKNQKEFVEISAKINVIKFKVSKEYDNTKNLFESILQKVFNGQLNFNVDFELDALIREIDLQKKENDLSKIVGDIAYLQRLIDKLNSQEFKEKELYDKAKHGVFQLMAMKEEESKVIQEYDEKSKSLKLALK